MTNTAPEPHQYWKIEDIDDPESFPHGCFELIYFPDQNTPKTEIERNHKLSSRFNLLSQHLGTEADPSKPYPERINQIRINKNKELRTIAEDLCNGKIDEDEAREERGRLSGEYHSRSNQVQNIEAVSLDEIAEGKESSGNEKTIIRLKFNKLPDEATSQQTALAIEIQKTYDVVDIVMDRRKKEHKKIYKAGKVGKFIEKSNNLYNKQINLEQKNYLKQLKDIANEGLLSQELTSYSEKKLEIFKISFVQRQADRIKNKYIKDLGIKSFLFSIVILFIILTIQVSHTQHKLLDLEKYEHELQSYLFLSLGACAGVWLSFSLRRVELGFDDLILLEPDRLNPIARIIFVVLLTCILGGILQLEWIKITISTTDIIPTTNPGTALLIGVFCGIAERSLSGAVANRAENMFELLRSSKSTQRDI